jgi:hypothetical protein
MQMGELFSFDKIAFLQIAVSPLFTGLGIVLFLNVIWACSFQLYLNAA